MIYILFLTLYLFQYCICGEENKITTSLEVPNEKHIHYLDIIKEKFEDEKEQDFFSFKNCGLDCQIENIHILFKNSSEEIHKLFTEKNENALKEALDEFKVKFYIALQRVSTSNLSSFRSGKNNPQRCILKYISDFRNLFYDLNDNLFPIFKGKNKNTEEDNLNQIKGSTYDYENIEGKNSDLSEKDEVDNNANTENDQSSPNFTYSSQSMSVYNYKNAGSVSDANININEPLTKQDALDILLRYTILRINGQCSKIDDEKNNSPLKFSSSISKNTYSASTNLSNKNGLSTEVSEDKLSNALQNKENMDNMIKRIFEFINKTFANEFMISDLFKKFNVTDSSLEQQNLIEDALSGDLVEETLDGVSKLPEKVPEEEKDKKEEEPSS